MDPIVKGWIINIEVKASKIQRQNILKNIHAADKIMRDKIRNNTLCYHKYKPLFYLYFERKQKTKQ